MFTGSRGGTGDLRQRHRGGNSQQDLMFPHERLLLLARDAWSRGRWRAGVGDGGRSKIVKIALSELLRNLRPVR